MQPRFTGAFATPSGDQVKVLWHDDGLEEYFVNGERVLRERSQETKFTRYFPAGKHQVRIEFSLFRFACSAYVDNELVAPELFPDFRSFRDWRQSYWPSTNSWIGGIKASRQGFWAASSIAIISIVLPIYSIRVSPLLDEVAALFILFQGFVYILLAFGIHKHSRVAAVVALAWYSIAQAMQAIETESLPGLLPLLLVFFLIHGVRGVFAVHRFPEPPDIAPEDRVRKLHD